MVAEAAGCTCRECGAICHGRFNGCAAVWSAGPVVRTAGPTSGYTAVVEANPLAKRPKHRNKQLARSRVVVEAAAPAPLPAPGPAASPTAAVTIPVPAPTLLPPPKGLAEIRARLEGVRGQMKVLGSSLDGPYETGELA